MAEPFGIANHGQLKTPCHWVAWGLLGMVDDNPAEASVASTFRDVEHQGCYSAGTAGIGAGAGAGVARLARLASLKAVLKVFQAA